MPPVSNEPFQPKKKPRRRWLRALLVFLLLLAIALPVAAHFAKPWVFEKLQSTLEDRLGVAVSIGAFDYSLAGAATIDDLLVANPAPFAARDPYLLKVKHIGVRLSIPRLLIGRVHIVSLEIDRPEAVVVLADPSGNNLGPVFKRLSEGPSDPEAKKTPLVFDEISLTDGTIRFYDEKVRKPRYELITEHFAVTITDLHVNDPVEGMPGRIDVTADVRTVDHAAPLSCRINCGSLGGLLDATVGGDLRKFDTRTIEPYATSYAETLLGGTGMEVEWKATITQSQIEGEVAVISLADKQRYTARVYGPLGNPQIDAASVLANAFKLPFTRFMSEAGKWIVGQGSLVVDSVGNAVKTVGGAVGGAVKGIGHTIGGLFGGDKKEEPPPPPGGTTSTSSTTSSSTSTTSSSSTKKERPPGRPH